MLDSLFSWYFYGLACFCAQSVATVGALFVNHHEPRFLAYFIELSLFLQIGLASKWLSAIGFCLLRLPLWAVTGLTIVVDAIFISLFILWDRVSLPARLLVSIELLHCLPLLIGFVANIYIRRWRYIATVAQDSLSYRVLRHHFLFNTLNTTAYLIHVQPDVAEDNLIKLAELYRLLLRQQSLVTLQEEIVVVRHYLDLEQARFGDRLTVEWILSNQLPKSTLMPAMLLQPLVENAVYYGIEPDTTASTIRIAIVCGDDKHLHFELRNPCATHRPTSGNHLSQRVIQKRLHDVYGDDYFLSARQEGNEYIAEFKIPYKEIN